MKILSYLSLLFIFLFSSCRQGEGIVRGYSLNVSNKSYKDSSISIEKSDGFIRTYYIDTPLVTLVKTNEYIRFKTDGFIIKSILKVK